MAVGVRRYWGAQPTPEASSGARLRYSLDEISRDLLAFNVRGKEREINVCGAGSRSLIRRYSVSEDAGAGRLGCWQDLAVEG